MFGSSAKQLAITSVMNSENQGLVLLRAVKRTSARSHSLCLPVGSPVKALLRPVALAPHLQSQDDVHALTDWRNRHVSAFLTNFNATDSRTSTWLSDSVLEDDSRILFMLDLLCGATVGYLGLAFIDWSQRYAEADSIVRGMPAEKGLMKLALLEMVKWAETSLGLQSFGVRVRSDNPALSFYRNIGFTEVRSASLTRTEKDEVVTLAEDGGGEPTKVSLVHMRFAPSLKDRA